jgi:hypothetical protein
MDARDPMALEKLLRRGTPWGVWASAEFDEEDPPRVKDSHDLADGGPPGGDEVKNVATQHRVERAFREGNSGGVRDEEREWANSSGVRDETGEHGRSGVNAHEGDALLMERKRDPSRSHADLE